MQKAEFELNLSRSSSGRARSRGLRSPHSKRLGSLEPTVCSLGWFYADTDLRPGSPPCRPRRPRLLLCPPDGAHRARGFATDVTGKVSNSGARPPETEFTLLCVTERSTSLLRGSLSFSLSLVYVRSTRVARCIRLAIHPTLDIKHRHSLLIIFIENYNDASARLQRGVEVFRR